MNELRRRFERFCLKNRNRGIPNLMFVLAIANIIVYLLTAIDPSRTVLSWLRFHPTLILQGQVWRLFTYLFTYLCDATGSNLLLGLVSLYCYTQFGKLLEQQWGSFRFNLYYFCGVLLCDIAALILSMPLSAASLNLSLFLAIATLIPEAQVLLFFIIPIKMKYMAWVYLGITALELISSISIGGFFSMMWLIPIVPLLNYFLFFGGDVLNLFPSVRYRPRPKSAARP
ncbi:MAG: rhomboid family intramembrane serine protease, partial [Oscillospiraceae bacterium]|nr:rhomboid family intramembrane serine protease [Oscillospiraceae bacterium]